MNKPKKPDAIGDLLRDSLLAGPPPAPVEPAEEAAPPPKPKPKPARHHPPSPQRVTATISLHGEEQEKAARILEILLRSRRKGGGLSDAVKVALQLCPLDPDQILAAWERSRAQDGRSRRRPTQ